MAWQGIDRRTRARANYPCTIVVLRTDLRQSFSTHTENISGGGTCVILPKELPKNCPVEVLLYLKDGGGALSCNGRAVWVAQKQDIFSTGIQFLDISEVDALRIEKVVQECLGKKT